MDPHQIEPRERVTDALRPAPAIIVALAWSAALAAVTIGAVSGEDWSHVLRLAITAVVYAPVAAILWGRRLAAVGVIIGALAITSGLLALVVVIAAGSSPLVPDVVVFVVAAIARLPEIAALAVMPWLFVRRARRLRTGGIVLGLGAIALDLALSIGRFNGVDSVSAVQTAPLALALLSLVLAGSVLVAESRRDGPREREALLWFALGATFMVASYVRVAVTLAPAAATFTDAAFVLAQALLPTAILALALDGRTLADDRRLFSSVVHVQSLAFGISLYLVVERVAILAGVPGAVAGACGAGVLALTFSSMTGLVRRRTARLAFGTTIDGREALARLGDRLDEGDGRAEGAIRALAQSLRDTWDLSSVRISPASGLPAVTVGAPAPAVETIALATGGRAVAALEVSSRDPAVLRTSVVPVITEIAPLLAVAIALALVNNDVAETRRRTLGIREEERRMLHRELLDGLAPALAGIGFGMAAAGHRLAAGAPVRDELATLRAHVSSSAGVVRGLARALLPAALDAGDLDAALTELAQRLSTPRAAIAVRAEGADVLAAETQVSVYLMMSALLSLLTREGSVEQIIATVALTADEVRVDVIARDSGDAPEEMLDRQRQEEIARIVADNGGTVVDPPHGATLRAVIRR